MSGIGLLIGEAIATTVLREWLDWQAKQQRPAGYVWSDTDIQAFVNRIDADTPEVLKAEVEAEDSGRTPGMV